MDLALIRLTPCVQLWEVLTPITKRAAREANQVQSASADSKQWPVQYALVAATLEDRLQEKLRRTFQNLHVITDRRFQKLPKRSSRLGH